MFDCGGLAAWPRHGSNRASWRCTIAGASGFRHTGSAVWRHGKHIADVCFGSDSVIQRCLLDVRIASESGSRSALLRCRASAISDPNALQQTHRYSITSSAATCSVRAIYPPRRVRQSDAESGPASRMCRFPRSCLKTVVATWPLDRDPNQRS